MKALTLWQPWASLCVIPRPCPCGRPNQVGSVYADQVCHDDRIPFKTIETRSWKAPESLIGQRIAIHAAKRPAEFVSFGSSTFVSSRRGHCRHVVGSPVSRVRELFTPDGAFYDLPLGAVVGTAVLVDCVPMTVRLPGAWAESDEGMTVLLVDGVDDIETLALWRLRRDGLNLAWRGAGDVTDQIPFGIFEQGRWAWLLSDVERFDDPVPAAGRQGIWNWDEHQVGTSS